MVMKARCQILKSKKERAGRAVREERKRNETREGEGESRVWVAQGLICLRQLFQRCLSINDEYVEALVDFAVMCWARYRMADADRRWCMEKRRGRKWRRKRRQMSKRGRGSGGGEEG